MRRRFYGKPLPPKRQVRAHLDLLNLVKKADIMDVELNKKEVRELKIILYAEVKNYRDRMNHAASHGADYTEVDSEILLGVLCKIDPV